MKIVVAGGSGFLGRALSTHLAGAGHDVVVLTRSARGGGDVRQVEWRPDGTAAGAWVREVDGADTVINLSGAGIADRRWTRARKDLLRSSRLLPTQSVVEAIRKSASRPAVLIQGSAVGYHGVSDDLTFTETSPAGTDYLGRMCVEWETAAQPATDLGCRLVLLRTGIVLASDGGALRKMRLPFFFFAGGPIGTGRQVLSWIHRNDWVAMVAWMLDTPSLSGAVNATAPNPVTNAEFSKALGRALARPSWLPVPAFALRLLFGELADAALLGGQRVHPERALELGFQFQYADIDTALERM